MCLLETGELPSKFFEVFQIFYGYDNLDYISMFHLREKGEPEIIALSSNWSNWRELFSCKVCPQWNYLLAKAVDSNTMKRFRA